MSFSDMVINYNRSNEIQNITYTHMRKQRKTLQSYHAGNMILRTYVSNNYFYFSCLFNEIDFD